VSAASGPATETLDVGDRRSRRTPRLARLLVVWSPNREVIGRSLPLARGVAVTLGRAARIDGVVLDDASASREHATVTLADDSSAAVADLGSKNGTWVAAGRVTTARLQPGELVQVGRTFLQLDFAASLERFCGHGDFVGVGEAARRIAEAIARAGGHGRAVLIEGPTGAGKEVVAREIHRASKRPGPYVAVNCATLERELAAAELFGHAKGAYTGAARARPGLFGAADGGTLFLDEVGTLPPDIQPKLLRALQEGRVRRVGDEAESAVDVRVVAATNVALAALADIGEFRVDLRARLAATRIELPALAARREDIPVLVDAFLQRQGLTTLTATPRLLWALLAARWPLNVRGLQNVVLTAADEVEGELLDLGPPVEAALRDEEQGAAPSPAASPPEPVASAREPAEGSTRPDAAELEARLVAARGNIREVARSYGVHRNQLYRWLTHHGLDPKRYRS
jgi:DNA-binding NtrC family response regulator